jgi:PIN domain nuclease of toxin-antitoxin system
VKAIRDPGRGVFYSAASVWELEIKAARGQLDLPNDWLAVAEETGFLHIPVTAAEARASAHLPWHHADPFDRVLVAQARAPRAGGRHAGFDHIPLRSKGSGGLTGC